MIIFLSFAFIIVFCMSNNPGYFSNPTIHILKCEFEKNYKYKHLFINILLVLLKQIKETWVQFIIKLLLQ